MRFHATEKVCGYGSVMGVLGRHNNSLFLPDIMERTYTEGKSISEWNSPETAATYETAEDLIDGYYIRGVPLSKLIGGAKITDYTANS